MRCLPQDQTSIGGRRFPRRLGARRPIQDGVLNESADALQAAWNGDLQPAKPENRL
jgi:hypothetical protein